jgi:hypothetical protein
MRIVVIGERQLITAEAEPSPEILCKIVGGYAEALSVQGSGHVRGYCDDSGISKGQPPNVLATLFCRRTGSIGDREVLVGTVALTGGDGAGGYADCPDWVLRDLEALVPHARALGDLPTARPN